MKTLNFIKQIKSGEIDVVEHTHRVIEEAKKLNKEYNYFNTISEKQALQQAKSIEKNPEGKLAGLPISVKDCLCVKDVESTAGSKILKGYIPPFTATAVQKAINEGAIVIGKTTQDEFGFGSFSTNTELKPKNPHNQERVCGGSSGGAAGFTAITNYPHIAIAESTGGSIVNPASFCGVVGLCPTYGLVSRYGLIDYANSLDKIGPVAKTVEDTNLMLSVIAGHDSKDSTSLKDKSLKDSKVKKIGIIKESLNINPEIKDLILSKVEKYELISLPTAKKYSIPTYYLIAMAEASTNLARYCGLRYGLHKELKGNFDDYFSSVRSSAFSKEAKRRIILGTFARMAGFRDAYYLKAMKVRTLIIEEYKKAFKKFDILISPTMPIIAPKFSEVNKLTPLENYMMDALTAGPNLAGLPHISTNAGSIEKMPVGIMCIANHLEENKLFNIATNLK